MPDAGKAPGVASGFILAYRLFDVAYAIDLVQAEETWARTVRTGSSRGRLTSPPKAISFGEPPVAIGLGTVVLSLPDGSARRPPLLVCLTSASSASHCACRSPACPGRPLPVG